MPNNPTLLLLILIPLIGAAITFLIAKKSENAAPVVAFLISLIPLGIVLEMLAQFDFTASGVYQFAFERPWLKDSAGLQFLLGVDSISLWLIVLTAVLTPISILASFTYIKERKPEFYGWLLLLHAAMLGVFAARDLLLFYLFFEFTLIPMFFVIGIWGGSDRRKAAGKFFLFTFAGSVFTLAAIVYLAWLNYKGYYAHGLNIPGTGVFTFAIADLQKFAPQLPAHTQCLIFLGLLAGFAVKVPLFPVHTWLPLAHTEAPTAGSVILAGVLLKLGTYGLLRYALPTLPEATLYFAPYIATFCIIGIIYGALVSWVQQDMKKLVAYSSVSHLGFCVLGMFALTDEGLKGSILYMINHGLSTGGLFLIVGMIYERYHTRDMNQLNGLARRVPALSFFAIFFVFASVALPGLNGFVSEFLVLLGTFVSGQPGHGGYLGPKYAIWAATGVILGAVYMLYWAGRVIFSPLKEPAHEEGGHDEHASHHAVADLNFREWAVLVPVAAAILFLGIYPKPVMDSLTTPVSSIQSMAMDTTHTARPTLAKLSTPPAVQLVKAN